MNRLVFGSDLGAFDTDVLESDGNLKGLSNSKNRSERKENGSLAPSFPFCRFLADVAKW